MGFLALLWTPVSILISRYYIDKEKKRKEKVRVSCTAQASFCLCEPQSHTTNTSSWYRTLGIPDRRPTADEVRHCTKHNRTRTQFPRHHYQKRKPPSPPHVKFKLLPVLQKLPSLWQMSKPDRTLPYHIFCFRSTHVYLIS